MGNIRGPVISMLDTMTKCIGMGMTLNEVIYRSTVTPAQAIRRPELGTMSVGSEADVAVLNYKRGEYSFQDCGYTRMDLDGKLECVMTLRAGKIEYERDGLSVPLWEDAPESYWPVAKSGDRIERYWRAWPGLDRRRSPR